MATFFTDLRQTFVPDMSGKQGPLPQLLVGLTLVTGLVDAFSYLVLGHVFVANMTGNVVFLGFALAGAPGFSIPASGGAILAFALGALVGGRLSTRLGQHRGLLLSTAAGMQAAFFATSVILAALSDDRVTAAYRYALIILLAVSMGIQNATARKLAVPDLTTTVLTMTITGVSADSAVAGGKGSKAGRRAVSVAAMLIGALVGAVLVIHVHVFFPLLIALVIVAVIAAVTIKLGKSESAWLHPES